MRIRPFGFLLAILVAPSTCPAQVVSSNGTFDRLVSSERIEATIARVARAEVPEARRKVLPYAVGSVGNTRSATSLTGIAGAQFACGHADGCAASDNPRADVSVAYSSINLDLGPTLEAWSTGASYRVEPAPAGWDITPFVQYSDLSDIEEEVGLGVAFDRKLGPVNLTVNIAGVRAAPDLGPDRDDFRFGAGLSWKTPMGFSIAIEHEVEDDVNGGASTIASLKSGLVKFSVSDAHAVKGSIVLPF